MGWREMLEGEHRLVLEVTDVVARECAHALDVGSCRKDLMANVLSFFRYFVDGLHDSREEGLLWARCSKCGMKYDAQPLAKMKCDRDWCRRELDCVQRAVEGLDAADQAQTKAVARRLKTYVDEVRRQIEAEEHDFFDLAEQRLTKKDQRELTREFEWMHDVETEEGVLWFWEEQARQLLFREAADAQDGVRCSSSLTAAS
jgi:hemerythrin-like domain-containing protein